jgi:hypothetical protein
LIFVILAVAVVWAGLDIHKAIEGADSRVRGSGFEIENNKHQRPHVFRIWARLEGDLTVSMPFKDAVDDDYDDAVNVFAIESAAATRVTVKVPAGTILGFKADIKTRITHDDQRIITLIRPICIGRVPISHLADRSNIDLFTLRLRLGSTLGRFALHHFAHLIKQACDGQAHEFLLDMALIVIVYAFELSIADDGFPGDGVGLAN